MSINRRWLIIAAVAISFAVKMALAVQTYGTNDALTWEADLEKIRSEGGLTLYRDGVIPHRGGALFSKQRFSHPPFMIRTISAWGWLADKTGFPLRFWIRLTCGLADVVSVILLLRILNALRTSLSLVSVLLVILSPISILISGFHVNTDPIMVSFVLLSIYLVQRGSPVWLAGCAMGMAINIKIVPILFIPAACMYLRDWRKALAFSGGIGIVVGMGSIPEVLQDPLTIWNGLSGYSSGLYIWGTSRLSWALLPENLYTVYSHSLKTVMLAAILGVSVWMNTKKPIPLILQIAFVSFLFFSLTPGFAVQYLAWLVPWSVLLGMGQATLFHALSGAFLFLLYHRASRGLWYLANTFDTYVWGGLVVYLGLFLWVLICVITLTLLARFRVQQRLGCAVARQNECMQNRKSYEMKEATNR